MGQLFITNCTCCVVWNFQISKEQKSTDEIYGGTIYLMDLK